MKLNNVIDVINRVPVFSFKHNTLTSWSKKPSVYLVHEHFNLRFIITLLVHGYRSAHVVIGLLK